MDVNKVILIGRATSDAQMTEFETGGKVARFSLATNKRAYTKNGIEYPGKTEFHRISVAFPSLVDYVIKRIKKGYLIYVEGELQTKKTADSNYYTFIFARDVSVLKYPNTEPYNSTKEPSTEAEQPLTNMDDIVGDLPF